MTRPGLLYVEEEVAAHPRVAVIRRRFADLPQVPCRRYTEIFNRRGQSFRLQKRRPALILAAKHGHRVLPTPAGYGLGHSRGFYFSHMLNCLYDCRYCFLQGMYRSAHYVLFVNYEDFQQEIDERLAEAPGEELCFFSGYDCDSLAFEAVTGFTREMLPFFARRPRAWLELRTKSTQIRPLLAREPLARCIVAYSLSPEEVARALEHGAPAVDRRLDALERLGRAGWPLGLRFDPLILHPGWRESYRLLFEAVFSRLRPEWLHSVSLGLFRLPHPFHKRLLRLYPDEPLFAAPLDDGGDTVTYPGEIEAEMTAFCRDEILRRVPREILHPCQT